MKKLLISLPIIIITIMITWLFIPNIIICIFTSKNHVTETPLEKNLLIHKLIENPNYQDGFSVNLSSHNLNIDEVILKSFKNQNSFVKNAMNFDSTPYPDSKQVTLNLRDQIGQFTILQKNQNEVVLGEKNYPYYAVSYSINKNPVGSKVNIHTLTDFKTIKGKYTLKL